MSITGEVGTGKTTLIHFLFHCLDERVKTVFIVHPLITFEELLSIILLNLDQVVREETKQALLSQLSEYLMEKMGEDETLVVIIDEAQNLPVEVMEEIERLFEVNPRVAQRLEVIFAGQPEFQNKISTPRLRQFNQKIGLRCQINALTKEESKKYIDHRLKLVGSKSWEVFTPKAISMIIGYARGIPRIINILCDNAFMIGYGLSKRRVDEDIIRKAIKDMEGPIRRNLFALKLLRLLNKFAE